MQEGAESDAGAENATSAKRHHEEENHALNTEDPATKRARSDNETAQDDRKKGDTAPPAAQMPPFGAMMMPFPGMMPGFAPNPYMYGGFPPAMFTPPPFQQATKSQNENSDGNNEEKAGNDANIDSKEESSGAGKTDDAPGVDGPAPSNNDIIPNNMPFNPAMMNPMMMPYPQFGMPPQAFMNPFFMNMASNPANFARARSAPARAGMVLAMACDVEQLSDYQILVRQQLEIFEAVQEDVESNTQGRKKPVVLGQVGLRCRHCAPYPLRARGRGAVYYPAKLTGIYQAAQNMAGSHLCQSCQHIPVHLKQELQKLRERRDNASGGKTYWADGCKALGIFEDNNCLRLRRQQQANGSPSSPAKQT